MKPQPARAIYAEFVPYRQLLDGGVLSLLRERNIALLIAVSPADLPQSPDLIKAAHDAGLVVGLWPMLGRAEGRWLSGTTLVAFRAMVARLFEVLDSSELPEYLVVDLEPPIGRLEGMLAGERRALWSQLRTPSHPRWQTEIEALIEEADDFGVETIAAAIPLVLGDRWACGWQRFLDTPLHGFKWSQVSYMAYSSMMEAFGGGLVRRRDALDLLALAARQARLLHGCRASLSLGCVGQGALGDERCYRSSQELAQDVGLARGAGIEHLILYALDGVLARPPVEAWLDSFTMSEAIAAPRMSGRSLALASGARVGSLLLEAGFRFARR